MTKDIIEDIKKFDNNMFLYNEHRIEFIELKKSWEDLKEKLLQN